MCRTTLVSIHLTRGLNSLGLASRHQKRVNQSQIGVATKTSDSNLIERTHLEISWLRHVSLISFCRRMRVNGNRNSKKSHDSKVDASSVKLGKRDQKWICDLVRGFMVTTKVKLIRTHCRLKLLQLCIPHREASTTTFPNPSSQIFARKSPLRTTNHSQRNSSETFFSFRNFTWLERVVVLSFSFSFRFALNRWLDVSGGKKWSAQWTQPKLGPQHHQNETIRSKLNRSAVKTVTKWCFSQSFHSCCEELNAHVIA